MLAHRDSFEIFPLAADSSSLLKTRVRGFDFEKQNCIGASSWLSSTALWASEYQCDGMAYFSTVQRYYASAYGRFTTPDRLNSSAHARNPQSWNRYAYVGGDPVNRRDPRGTCWVSDNGNQVEDGTVTDEDALAGYGYQHVDASCGGYSGVSVTDSAPDPCQGSDAGCGGSGSIATQINNDDGAGGGGDPLWDVMGAAFNNALKELENPECAQAIGQGTLGQTTYTASMVLSLLQAGSVFGSITAAAIPNVILPDGRIGVVGAQTKDSSTVRYPNGMTYDTVQITVNNSAGAFVNGTTEDRTRLLLHELGHAMSFIFGPGTNGFDQTDFEAPGKSGGNDALVAKNCFQ